MKHLKISDIRSRLLVAEAEKWLGISERGGNNKGQVVEFFQKAVDGRATGEAWCMGFVQYCLDEVDRQIDKILDFELDKELKAMLHPSEHCLTVWNRTFPGCRLVKPRMGSIAIWQHGSSAAGHTGIVTSVNPSQGWMTVIEGNTGPEDKEVVREGDGVYQRRRSMIGQGKMKIKGFLNPWPTDLEFPLQ